MNEDSSISSAVTNAASEAEAAVLPCELVAGHMRFGKGVPLSTVAKYIVRLQKYAQEANPIDPEHVRRLQSLIEENKRDNEFFANVTKG